ncbi:MAG: hypothetical protein NVSMB26_13380 [Beijerinckiaceae bacterium]
MSLLKNTAILGASTLALFASACALAVRTEAADPIMIRRTVVKERVLVRRAEAGAIFSSTVLRAAHGYATGQSPGSAAVYGPVPIYTYGYAPDYGYAYRLAPPPLHGIPVCYAEPQLVYNSGGVFVGYGQASRCY